MGSAESTGPIIVCLDDEHDAGPLVQCGAALARLLQAPLCLAFLLVIPPQRPLDVLTGEEERQANSLLDVAAELAEVSGVVPTEEVWPVRSLDSDYDRDLVRRGQQHAR